MSGKRCKALRREFKRVHGRAVNGSTFKETERTSNVAGKFMRWLQRETVQPSEWRHIKRDWRRRAAYTAWEVAA